MSGDCLLWRESQIIGEKTRSSRQYSVLNNASLSGWSIISCEHRVFSSFNSDVVRIRETQSQRNRNASPASNHERVDRVMQSFQSINKADISIRATYTIIVTVITLRVRLVDLYIKLLINTCIQRSKHSETGAMCISTDRIVLYRIENKL